MDSAAAAALVLRAGHTAEGVTLRLTGTEREEAEIARARESAATLGLPHTVLDLREEFGACVVRPFAEAYRAGRTPNPCVLCNREIKLGALYREAMRRGFDRVATGHYARIALDDGRPILCRARDPHKDQSYMLHLLSAEVLSHLLLPLGELTQAEARAIAEECGLAAARAEESQDICFVPDGDYAAFIQRFTGKVPQAGAFINTEGKVLGQHKGQLRYTIGQRKGLGIALGKPAFVVAKSATENTVTLGENSDLYTTRLTATGINLIPFDRLDQPMRLYAKARYRQEAAPARVEQTDERTLTVEFETPQRAISPGQSLVLYDDDYVIGGGFIC